MSHRLHPAAVARTTDEARRGRSDRDWAAINDPERARQATAELLAGDFPDRDRAIREGFTRTYDAYNRRDWELNTLLMHLDQYVLRLDPHGALPDAREEYHGVEGYLELNDLWLETWSDHGFELVDLLATNEDRVVTFTRFTGLGARSGTPFDQHAVIDHLLRDGLLVVQTFWWNAERGADELGLQLPPARR